MTYNHIDIYVSAKSLGPMMVKIRFLKRLNKFYFLLFLFLQIIGNLI